MQRGENLRTEHNEIDGARKVAHPGTRENRRRHEQNSNFDEIERFFDHRKMGQYTKETVKSNGESAGKNKKDRDRTQLDEQQSPTKRPALTFG